MTVGPFEINSASSEVAADDIHQIRVRERSIADDDYGFHTFSLHLRVDIFQQIGILQSGGVLDCLRYLQTCTDHA